MKLLTFLGVALPFAHVYAAQLSYSADGSGDIASFSFEWQNTDRSANTQTGGADGTTVTDGDLETGIQLENPSAIWGKVDNPTGMTGTFAAESLNLDAGKVRWMITSASITFTSTSADCIGDASTAAAFYYDADTGDKSILGDASITTADSEITFEAEIPSGGVPTNGAIGFTVSTNLYCTEAEIFIVEFVLEGEAETTPEPTPLPTMSPVKSCNGHITWGDPHYYPMATDAKKIRFDYQGYGWHYYFFPCDNDLFEAWPFFFLQEHDKWNSATTITVMNMLIINTKPDPWIIKFEYEEAFTKVDTFEITVGTDSLGRTDADFDIRKPHKKYTEDDPLLINYNDNQATPQSGTLKIYWKKEMIYVELSNVRFDGYPRTCAAGSGSDCGKYVCDADPVISIANRGYTTMVTCPLCFRNVACGLMGKYIRGDCVKKDLADASNECYNILQGSDGTFYTPPTSNTQFVPFGESWHKDVVDALLEASGKTVSWSKSHHFHREPRAVPEPRAVGDTSTGFLGECEFDAAIVAQKNESCRLNTVVKYATCCAEIGICNDLWAGCVYDLCACSDSTGGVASMTEEECLNLIIHDSLNATCGWDPLWPTDAPTSAPTGTPTKYTTPKEVIPQAQKLIWLYLIFVVVFVIIAVGAYCYYKKKTRGKAYVPTDEEVAEMEAANGVETFTHT